MNTKKVLFLFFFATVCGLAFAMVENTHIKISYVITKTKIGGAMGALTKEQTYKMEFPTELAYHKDKDNTYCWNSFYISMTAKKGKSTDQTYKTIEIVSPGMTPLEAFEDVQVPLANDPSRKGWVRKINYTFPIKLVMRNAANEIEKELILTDNKNVFQGIYHAGFFTPSTSFRPEENVTVPYPTLEQLQKAAAGSKSAIMAQLEKNRLSDLFFDIRKAIAAAYDYNKVSAFNMTYYQIGKKDLDVYPQFATMSEKFAAALKNMGDDTKYEDAIAGLKECNSFYKDQLGSADKLPDDIVKMCLYHRAIASLILGDIPEANALFSKYYVNYMKNIPFGERNFEENFINLYNVYVPYYQIKQTSGLSVIMDVPVTAYSDKIAADKAETKLQAQKDSAAKAVEEANCPNINGKPGYIVLTSGKKIDGKIYIHFVDIPTSSGIVDMDRFSSVDVAMTVNGKEEKKRYASKDISYCMAGEQRYEHLNVKENAVMGMLGKLTGNAGSSLFYLKYYEVPGFTLFQRPTGTEFFIKRNSDDSAYHIEDIIKSKKVAKPFVDACSNLQKKIENKDISDIKDAKQLADWLSNNCK